MDSQRQQTLWAIAIENYQAAALTAQHGWHNVSVACSYYTVFTALWVALGTRQEDAGSMVALLSGLPQDGGVPHQRPSSAS